MVLTETEDLSIEVTMVSEDMVESVYRYKPTGDVVLRPLGEERGFREFKFIAEGLRRFRIVKWISDKPPYKVQVEYPNEPGKPESEEIKAYAMALIKQIRELLPLNPLYKEHLRAFPLAVASPT